MNVFKSYAELVFISKQVYVCVRARGVCVCVCVCVWIFGCARMNGEPSGDRRAAVNRDEVGRARTRR